MLFLLVVASLFGQGLSDGFNRALHYPDTPSVENYVKLHPDFSGAEEQFSVCSWIKITIDSGLPWFSYATNTDYNTIILKGKDHHNLRTTSGVAKFEWSDVTLVQGEWYHQCFTWKPGHVDFYMNGVKIQTTGNPPSGKMIMGGTLVVGQEQDTLGGGFELHDLFGGEIYNMNAFKTKLTQEEVVGMYYSGRCARLGRSHRYKVVLSWENILEGERYGAVTEVDAGCNRWALIEDLSAAMTELL